MTQHLMCLDPALFFKAACGRRGERIRLTTRPEDVTCQSCIDTRLMRAEPLWSERVKAMAARFP